MAIAKTDIKLLASQDLTDNDSGGGAMTSDEVVGGAVNNLFSDISRLDRTIGRVSLRKAFLAVQTANTDTYFGPHVILTDPPDDQNVSVTMFSTDSYTDTRTAAQNKVESYVVRGVLSRMRLYDNQLEGQRTLLCLAPVDVELPEIGLVYNLVEDDGLATEFEQFVRVTSVDTEIQAFSDTLGSYDMRVITLGISDPLLATYHGGTPDRYDTDAQANDQAVIRKTTVANSSKYYGVSKLAVDIANTDLSFTVDSVYASLVPSSQAETPLADILVGGDTGRLIASSVSPVTVSQQIDFTTKKIYTGSGMVRGSVTLTHLSTTYIDDGLGNMAIVSGSGTNTFFISDYAQGIIDSDSQSTTTTTVTFTPATQINDVADTDRIDITIQNRGLTYIKTLLPIPTPGSLVIDYMALGVWFRLRDQGDGVIVGDQPNTGTGTINFATGTVTLTLAALPDADTAILFGWGGDQHYTIRDTSADIPNMLIEKTLLNSVFPGSLSISWLSGGVAKTASDDGAGNITGDGTGAVVYSTGQFYLQPAALVDPNTDITVDYTSDTTQTETFDVDDNPSGQVSFTLANANVEPGSVEVFYKLKGTLTTEANTLVPVYAEVDGGYIVNGAFVEADQVVYENPIYITDITSETVQIDATARDDGAGGFETVGDTVNYVTGAVVITVHKDTPIIIQGYDANTAVEEWSEITTTWEFEQQFITVKYNVSTGTPTTHQEIFQPPSLQIDLLPKVSDSIMPGSVRFTLGTDVFIDRSGLLYKNIDMETNFGTLAGSVNYLTGVATLTAWTGGQTNDVTFQSLLTQFGEWSTYKASFRTTGSPLKTLSFFISANAVDGTLLSDTADANGVLSTADITGQVDIVNGIANIKFGAYVVAAGNEAEPWYDVNELDGNGNVWKPVYVAPNSMKYNAVVFSYLPIDTELIGIDPVRLPEDGRVPIYRPGDVVVIHNTTSEATPDNLTSNQNVPLTGTDFSLIELYDQNQVLVDPNLYTVDLVLGEVTMAAGLDLSAYTQPLIAYKRIEDMKLLSDVQINGQLTVTSTINHDYTAGVTFVSSAIAFSDLASRAFNLLFQETWTNVWDDILIGDASIAKYNTVTYPVQVANDGAIEQRWALVFTSATTFDIVGETVGVIGTGITNGPAGTFTEPQNPESLTPYFRLQQEGWGSGWSTGNVMRFNTESANAPIWFARTTLPGEETEPTDQFTVQLRGDAN